MRPYLGFEFELTAPTGSTFDITFTQKAPNCVDRLADSTYRSILRYTTPNGTKQRVIVPLADFAQTVDGGNFSMQHLKDITFVKMLPVDARFEVRNLKMIGNCNGITPTTGPQAPAGGNGTNTANGTNSNSTTTLTPSSGSRVNTGLSIVLAVFLGALML